MPHSSIVGFPRIRCSCACHLYPCALTSLKEEIDDLLFFLPSSSSALGQSSYKRLEQHLFASVVLRSHVVLVSWLVEKVLEPLALREPALNLIRGVPRDIVRVRLLIVVCVCVVMAMTMVVTIVLSRRLAALQRRTRVSDESTSRWQVSDAPASFASKPP